MQRFVLQFVERLQKHMALHHQRHMTDLLMPPPLPTRAPWCSDGRCDAGQQKPSRTYCNILRRLFKLCLSTAMGNTRAGVSDVRQRSRYID